MSESTRTNRVERAARLRWVPIEKMKVSVLAQRDLNRSRVDKIAADFDLEQLGSPTVNERDGWFYIIDGAHRIAALKTIGYGDQQVQCWTYEGLTQEEEAERFLKLNDVLAVGAFAKFRIGVTAGRAEECDIDRLVRVNGLRISKDAIPGAVRAVGTLRRVYRRGGPEAFSRTLRITNNAYGDPGLEGSVIDGIGHLCARYNGELDDSIAVKKLGSVAGGVNGLLGQAERLHKATGSPKSHCVAAAAVEIINRGRGGKKLPDWWKS